MNPAARLSAALVGIVALAALAAQFAVNVADDPQDSAAEIAWRMARYFTILTNALVGVTFAGAALRGRSPGAIWAGGVTLWIAITGVVYYALLYRDTAGLEWWADIGMHGAAPVLTVLWWLAFAPKRGLGWRAALIWLSWPALYVAYALIRGAADGRFPYFFLDPAKAGWDGVALWIALLCAGFLGAGLGLVGVARLTVR